MLPLLESRPNGFCVKYRATLLPSVGGHTAPGNRGNDSLHINLQSKFQLIVGSPEAQFRDFEVIILLALINCAYQLALCELLNGCCWAPLAAEQVPSVLEHRSS